MRREGQSGAGRENAQGQVSPKSLTCSPQRAAPNYRACSVKVVKGGLGLLQISFMVNLNMFPGIAVDRLCTTMHILAMLGEFPRFEPLTESEGYLLCKE